MDIPLNVEVHCSDGAGGHSTAVVVNPRTLQATHVVVETEASKVLVPLDAVIQSAPDQIKLRWSRHELSAAAPFEKLVFPGETPGPWDMTGAYANMYSTADNVYIMDQAAFAYEREEQVPQGELVIHRNASVQATDGRVGQVDELMVESASGQITHLVLRQGHLWGKRDVTVPVSAIARIDQDLITLKLDKAALEQLPHAPVHKR